MTQCTYSGLLFLIGTVVQIAYSLMLSPIPQVVERFEEDGVSALNDLGTFGVVALVGFLGLLGGFMRIRWMVCLHAIFSALIALVIYCIINGHVELDAGQFVVVLLLRDQFEKCMAFHAALSLIGLVFNHRIGVRAKKDLAKTDGLPRSYVINQYPLDKV